MTYSSEVLADSPLGYWRLGESSGSTAADSSGNGRNGTYVGPTVPATGLLPYDADTAADFDGLDYVEIPHTSPMNTFHFTVEAWVRLDAMPSVLGMIALRRGYPGATSLTQQSWHLGILPTGRIELMTLSTGTPTTVGTAAGVITTGTTYHIVVTKQGATVVFYVNGAVVASTGSAWASPNDTVSRLLWGADRYSPGATPATNYGLDGRMDECAFYTGALSAARVLAHYTAGTTAPPADISGTLAGTAPSPVAALVGAATLTGTLAGTAPSPVAALVGAATLTGTLAGTAPSPVAALVGAATLTGTLAGTAPSPVAAAVGALTFPGVLAATAPMPSARMLAWGDPVVPRELLHRLLTIALPDGPDGIDLVPYARDIDPPARPTVLLRIDDVTRHPDAQQTQRRYGFTLILLGAGEGDTAEADLEDALEDVLWAVESSPELPQWTRAERGVWRDTTPAFEVAVPVDFTITDPATRTPA